MTEKDDRHWLRKALRESRGAFRDLMLISLFVNILVLSIPVFVLQVYDRVIPHQSEATLWVLAAGACLALLMEAFLKIARARLMDGAGRQIQPCAVSLLMERVTWVQADTRGTLPATTV